MNQISRLIRFKLFIKIGKKFFKYIFIFFPLKIKIFWTLRIKQLILITMEDGGKWWKLNGNSKENWKNVVKSQVEKTMRFHSINHHRNFYIGSSPRKNLNSPRTLFDVSEQCPFGEMNFFPELLWILEVHRPKKISNMYLCLILLEKFSNKTVISTCTLIDLLQFHSCPSERIRHILYAQVQL